MAVRKPRVCRNGDGNKHYAKGFCSKCYMDYYRKGKTPLPEDDISEGADVPLMTADNLDQVMNRGSSRNLNIMLATDEMDDDTDGIKLMRRRLAAQLHLARREVVRGMLHDGLEPWQIKNEFLSRPELYKAFLVTVKDPDRILNEDMEEIEKSGRLKPLERYIDGLKRSLRRANQFANDTDLTAKERSTWAKSADEMQRTLAIQENAIHVVPGRGDMPVGYDDEDDDEEEDSPFKLPDVEKDDDD